jgi:hypothetical protein
VSEEGPAEQLVTTAELTLLECAIEQLMESTYTTTTMACESSVEQLAGFLEQPIVSNEQLLFL